MLIFILSVPLWVTPLLKTSRPKTNRRFSFAIKMHDYVLTRSLKTTLWQYEQFSWTSLTVKCKTLQLVDIQVTTDDFRFVKDLGNFGWRSVEYWGFGIRNARRLTVKKLFLYLIKCCDGGPTVIVIMSLQVNVN